MLRCIPLFHERDTYTSHQLKFHARVCLVATEKSSALLKMSQPWAAQRLGSTPMKQLPIFPFSLFDGVCLLPGNTLANGSGFRKTTWQ